MAHPVSEKVRQVARNPISHPDPHGPKRSRDHTVNSYLDFLEGTFLIRHLPPCIPKSPWPARSERTSSSVARLMNPIHRLGSAPPLLSRKR